MQAEGIRPRDPRMPPPLITQDVAEHVFHDHYVELSGVKTEVGGGSIHQNVFDLHVRKISADFLHDFIPKHARLEHIALVNVMQDALTFWAVSKATRAIRAI